MYWRKEIQTSNKMRQIKTQYSHHPVISTINAFGAILLDIFSLKLKKLGYNSVVYSVLI